MNKTKRLLALVLALVMSLTLFACGQRQDGRSGRQHPDGGPPACSPTPAAARSPSPPTSRRSPSPALWRRWWSFAIAPDKMVGVANAWDETAKELF